MARRRIKDLVKVVPDSETWQNYVDNSDKVLVVADVHKTWCGPCEVMTPTFERLFLENDNCSSRCVFVSVDPTVLSEEQRASMPLHDGCKPLFLVYKHKVIIGKVEGVNSPELITLVSENIFPLEEDD